VAQAIGIAPATFKAYFKQAQQLGLIQDNRFISLREAIPTLLPQFSEEKQMQHFECFRTFKKTPSFKDYYERIKFALPLLNYQQQQFNIEKNKVLDYLSANRIPAKAMRALRKLQRKHGAPSLTSLPSIVKRTEDIVTGKFHTAALIGCAPSTAARLLGKWTKTGRISRTVCSDFIYAEQSHAAHDGLKEAGYKFCWPNKAGSGFYLNRGSKITVIKEIETLA